MMSKRLSLVCAIGLMAAFGFGAFAQTGNDKKKTEKKIEKKKEVWTDANDPTLPADFKFQGEYFAQLEKGPAIGCQVIALGNGAFQAVLLKRGLPGQGWNGKDKSLMDGQLVGDKVAFTPSAGKRTYLGKSPLEFAATSKFTPVPAGELAATIVGEMMTVEMVEGGQKHVVALKKLIRKSDSLGAKPPAGAIILFDGASKDEFNGGRIDKVTSLLNTDGGDVTTKRKFSSYTAHVEFMLPFRPDARGQGRGNSGFYQVDQYEVQILDSFGLDGKDNECGGVYTKAAPSINMCLPPLQWQTYDAEFTNAITENGKVVKHARLTLKHNGVVVHDNIEIKGVTGGARALDKKRNEPEGTPGLLRLQGHGNPLQFRNIWVVEKK